MLPLNLHVLGLPLAFILSQDQTLHCKKLKSTGYDVSYLKFTAALFQRTFSKNFSQIQPFAEPGGKYTQDFFSRNFNSYFFQILFQLPLSHLP